MESVDSDDERMKEEEERQKEQRRREEEDQDELKERNKETGQVMVVEDRERPCDKVSPQWKAEMRQLVNHWYIEVQKLVSVVMRIGKGRDDAMAQVDNLKAEMEALMSEVEVHDAEWELIRQKLKRYKVESAEGLEKLIKGSMEYRCTVKLMEKVLKMDESTVDKLNKEIVELKVVVMDMEQVLGVEWRQWPDEIRKWKQSMLEMEKIIGSLTNDHTRLQVEPGTTGTSGNGEDTRVNGSATPEGNHQDDLSAEEVAFLSELGLYDGVSGQETKRMGRAMDMAQVPRRPSVAVEMGPGQSFRHRQQDPRTHWNQSGDVEVRARGFERAGSSHSVNQHDSVLEALLKSQLAPEVGNCESKTIEEFERYIRCFETKYEWASATQLRDCLVMKLKGKALEVFEGLSREVQQGTYVQIVAAMETKLRGDSRITLEKSQKELRGLKAEKGHLKKYCEKLEKLTSIVYEDASKVMLSKVRAAELWSQISTWEIGPTLVEAYEKEPQLTLYASLREKALRQEELVVARMTQSERQTFEQQKVMNSFNSVRQYQDYGQRNNFPSDRWRSDFGKANHTFQRPTYNANESDRFNNGFRSNESSERQKKEQQVLNNSFSGQDSSFLRKKCFECGQEGHFRRGCPRLQGGAGQQQVMQRDVGGHRPTHSQSQSNGFERSQNGIVSDSSSQPKQIGMITRLVRAYSKNRDNTAEINMIKRATVETVDDEKRVYGKKSLVKGNILGMDANFLIDSGAQASVISVGWLTKAYEQGVDLDKEVKVLNQRQTNIVDISRKKITSLCLAMVQVKLETGKTSEVPFHVIENVGSELADPIIGTNTFCSLGISIVLKPKEGNNNLAAGSDVPIEKNNVLEDNRHLTHLPLVGSVFIKDSEKPETENGILKYLKSEGERKMEFGVKKEGLEEENYDFEGDERKVEGLTEERVDFMEKGRNIGKVSIRSVQRKNDFNERVHHGRKECHNLVHGRQFGDKRMKKGYWNDQVGSSCRWVEKKRLHHHPHRSPSPTTSSRHTYKNEHRDSFQYNSHIMSEYRDNIQYNSNVMSEYRDTVQNNYVSNKYRDRHPFYSNKYKPRSTSTTSPWKTTSLAAGM